MADGMQNSFEGQAGVPYAPTVRRQNSNACLLWLLGGCGALILVGIIAGALGSIYAGKKSGIGKMFQGAVDAPQCGMKVATIRNSLHNYQTDHKGKYPPKLESLIPQYLADPADLVCKSGAAGAGAIVYTPPRQKDPPDTVIISILQNETVIDLGVQKQSIRQYIRLLKDGHVVMDQLQRVEMYQAEPNRPRN